MNHDLTRFQHYSALLAIQADLNAWVSPKYVPKIWDNACLLIQGAIPEVIAVRWEVENVDDLKCYMGADLLLRYCTLYKAMFKLATNPCLDIIQPALLPNLVKDQVDLFLHWDVSLCAPFPHLLQENKPVSVPQRIAKLKEFFALRRSINSYCLGWIDVKTQKQRYSKEDLSLLWDSINEYIIGVKQDDFQELINQKLGNPPASSLVHEFESYFGEKTLDKYLLFYSQVADCLQTCDDLEESIAEVLNDWEIPSSSSDIELSCYS
ncbi:hypothetical protein [Moorena sp. SIO3A2]|uniref:hypothetical protein n=1 Tax=Moorena sp. SIO3A2 TaxID=2607841 RepID=UPI0013BA8D0B|nr:hypothetical protein [Moorena sp. SIO3A2]NER90398.1 hypothetical protein [Moorena sp. SIO3A2]